VLVLRTTELASRLAPQATCTATNSHQRREAATSQLPRLVVEVVGIYQKQPATPLPKLAEKLAGPPTEASRLRLQAMNLQLLERKTHGYYVPLPPAQRLLLASGNGDGNGK